MNRDADRPMFGKYRGRVVDNIDPLVLGRLLVEVERLPAVAATWAMPCVPYAGPQVGFYAIPPIGANVWVEFEGGDPDYPIWVGCFWGEGELPLDAPPELKVLKTEGCTLMLNDSPGAGGVRLTVEEPSVEGHVLAQTFDADGIRLDAEPATITLAPEEGVTIEFPPSTIAVTEESTEVGSGASSVRLTADGDINASAGAAIEMEASADVSLGAGGATEVSALGDVAIAGAAVDVSARGDVSVRTEGTIELGAKDLAVTAAATEIAVDRIAVSRPLRLSVEPPSDEPDSPVA